MPCVLDAQQPQKHRFLMQDSIESLISLIEAFLIDSFKEAILMSERGECTLVLKLYELTTIWID